MNQNGQSKRLLQDSAITFEGAICTSCNSCSWTTSIFIPWIDAIASCRTLAKKQFTIRTYNRCNSCRGSRTTLLPRSLWKEELAYCIRSHWYLLLHCLRYRKNTAFHFSTMCGNCHKCIRVTNQFASFSGGVGVCLSTLTQLISTPPQMLAKKSTTSLSSPWNENDRKPGYALISWVNLLYACF